MYIAVRTNVRVAMKALGGMNDAFVVAFRVGMVLGFVLVGLALLILALLMLLYRAFMFKTPLGEMTLEA